MSRCHGWQGAAKGHKGLPDPVVLASIDYFGNTVRHFGCRYIEQSFLRKGRSNNILSKFFQSFLVPWINGWPTIDIKTAVMPAQHIFNNIRLSRAANEVADKLVATGYVNVQNRYPA